MNLQTNKPDTDALKRRIMALKPLPARYMPKFVETFPEYDNLKGVDKVRDVVNLRRADKEVTEKLEKLFGGK